MHPKVSASHSEFSYSRDQTRPLRLSFALAMILTMNARRFQRTHLFRGMRDCSLNASKDFGLGVTDLAVAYGSEPMVDAVCTAVVGSARTGRVLEAGSAREDRSFGDARLSSSENDDDSILHTRHLCRYEEAPCHSTVNFTTSEDWPDVFNFA